MAAHDPEASIPPPNAVAGGPTPALRPAGRNLFAILAGAASLSMGFAAAAEEQADAGAGITPYLPAYFAEARPTTAFDMLQRLPGFTFDGGNEQVRGFSAATGNVLIDGERPTSKATTLEEQLRRIPASGVERIELIRGGAPGVNMQGRTLVANVVRVRVAASTTTLTGGGRYYGDGWFGPQADLEWTRRAGNLSLEGALHAVWETDVESGPGRLTYFTPSGAIRQTGPIDHLERGRTLSGSGAAELVRGDDTFRLNFGGEDQVEDTFEPASAFDAAGRALGETLVTERRTARQGEVGADWERVMPGGWTARLATLHTRRLRTSVEAESEPGEVEVSDERSKSGESILRGTVRAERSSALTWEGGAEAAFNFLDSHTRFSENGRAVVLPNANTRVAERRVDGFLVAYWKPTPRIATEFTLRAEASRISQSGDTRLNRSFFFAKPRAFVAISPNQGSQVRLRVEREVGQLDFGDFAASTELSGQTVTVGNPELEPERSWVFEAAFERRFWGRGAAILTLRHHKVSQVVDLIPIGGRFDAPGNIGPGSRDRLQLSITLPFDRLGVRGGLLTFEGHWRRSRVTDPVTGLRRRISGERPFNGLARFVQDIDALRSTWGVEAELDGHESAYRIDQRRKVVRGTYWSAYWDWKPNPALSVRVELQNFTRRDFRRTVVEYDGPRSLGIVDAVERRNHRFGMFPYFRVRKML